MGASVIFLLCFLVGADQWTSSTMTNVSEAQDFGNTSRSLVPCVLYCVIKDLSIIAAIFEERVKVKKARVLDLSVSIHFRKSEDNCPKNRNLVPSVRNLQFTIWALSDTEPYMNLPPDFFHFSNMVSLHLKEQVNVSMDCTEKKHQTSPQQRINNGELTRLHDAVTATLIRKLMQSTEGILCSVPQEAELKSSLKNCCKFQKSVSKITCNNVQFDGFGHWFDIMLWLWAFVALPLSWFLPKIICLFPWPRVSRDGTPCVVLSDPSPGGLRSLVVTTFIPQNMESLWNKIRLFFFKVVIMPLFIAAPIFLSAHFSITLTMHTFGTILAAVYWGHVVMSMLEIAYPSDQHQPCSFCEELFPEPLVHYNMADTVKIHILCLRRSIFMDCQNYIERFFEFYIDLWLFQFQSPADSLRSLYWLFLLFAAVILPVLLCILIVVIVPLCDIIKYCPLTSVIMSIIQPDNLEEHLKHCYITRHLGDAVRRILIVVMLSCSVCSLYILMYLSVLTVGYLLMYSVLLLAARSDPSLFRIMALLVHACSVLLMHLLLSLFGKVPTIET